MGGTATASSDQVLVTTLVLLTFTSCCYCYSDPGEPCWPTTPLPGPPLCGDDIDNMQFAQNMEHIEADFFLWGALGYGLDKVAPFLTFGGPPPIGVRKADLDDYTRAIITEYGYQEVAHLRVLKLTAGGIPRPLMDLSPKNFAKQVEAAFGYPMDPPFDPYRDSLSYMLGSYMLPYIGINGFIGSNPYLCGYLAKRVIAGLLSPESGQDAQIRLYLFERANETVEPYNFTVAEFTIKISNLTNRLGMCGIKDEGLFVPPELGAEGRICSNLLSLDKNSLAYPRSPEEIMRIMYGTGDEHCPGGFLPLGANGRIARRLLKRWKNLDSENFGADG